MVKFKWTKSQAPVQRQPDSTYPRRVRDLREQGADLEVGLGPQEGTIARPRAPQGGPGLYARASAVPFVPTNDFCRFLNKIWPALRYISDHRKFFKPVKRARRAVFLPHF